MEPDEKWPWADLLKRLLSDQGGATFAQEVYKFENEVKTTRYIHGSATVRQMLTDWMNLLPKVPVDVEGFSNQYREKGNGKFKEADIGSIAEAALLYTKAIGSAPPKTQALALAHGNRAAALFKLGEFEAAYNDCQCALDLKHPKTNVMLLRQAMSARSMSDATKFEACIEEMEKLQLGEKFPEVNEYRKELVNMNTNDGGVPVSTTSNVNHVPEKKQKILKSADSGRYVVADEPINCNEVIMAEEAFAFVPIFNEVGFILGANIKTMRYLCDNCAENDIVPFPCNSCQNAFYCSPRCREQHTPIHNIECNAYKMHLFPQVGIAYLALRSLLVVFDSLLEKLKNQRKSHAHPLKRAEQLWPLILDTARDGELMGLCTNYKAMEHNDDIVRYTLTASLLCCYLSQKSLFFQKTRRDRLAIMSSEAEWGIIIAALLLRLTSQMICNAHIIEGLVVKKPFAAPTYSAGRMFESVSFGTLFSAIYPRVSLYNHSCKPNFRNKFNKSKLYVVAKKNFATGNEIFNSYGVNSKALPREARRATLMEQYAFTCNCEECRKDDDVSYFQHNHIICNGHGCNTAYIPDPVNPNKCPVCRTKYDEKFYLRISHGSELLDESVRKYKYLYDLYVKMDRYLPRYTMLRFATGHSILMNFSMCDSRSITSNEKVTRRMLNIAIELIETREEAEGIGVEFVHSAAFVLDILALRKTNGLERINTGFDLMKIKRALDVLTPRQKRKFEKYFDAYAN